MARKSPAPSTIAGFIAILGNVLIVIGTFTPWWWKVSFGLSAVGTSNILFGLFRTCFVWFCAFRTDRLCNAGGTVLGDSGALQCRTLDSFSGTQYESQWKSCQAMAVLGIIFGIIASLTIMASWCVGNSFSSKRSPLKIAGAVLTLCAGICGTIVLILLYDFSRKNDMATTASSLTLGDRDWISASSASSHSFRVEAAGSAISILSAITMIYFR